MTALLAVGCGSCGGSNGGEGAATGETEEGPALGTVEGVVRLAPGAELPSRPPEDLGDRPAPPESCTPPRTVDRQPVRMGGERGLEGVLVAASEFDASPEHEPVAHEVTITDCRLEPRLVVATRGDHIALTNETEYPFMPIMGSGGLAQALLHGQTRQLELDQGGVNAIACTFTAPCGQTDVVTLYHPFHTTTGEAGRFTLEVPAGEEIEVHAWHPLFEESGQTFTVEPGETKRIELVLRPSAQAAAPAAPDAEDAAGETEGSPSDEAAEAGEAAPEDDAETLF